MNPGYPDSFVIYGGFSTYSAIPMVKRFIFGGISVIGVQTFRALVCDDGVLLFAHEYNQLI